MGLFRSWLIRGLILSVLAAVVAAGWIAHGWVSPEQVRSALVEALAEQFPGTDIEVGSAKTTATRFVWAFNK